MDGSALRQRVSKAVLAWEFCLFTSVIPAITDRLLSATPQSLHFPLSITFPQREWQRSHSGFYCRSTIP